MPLRWTRPHCPLAQGACHLGPCSQETESGFWAMTLLDQIQHLTLEWDHLPTGLHARTDHIARPGLAHFRHSLQTSPCCQPNPPAAPKQPPQSRVLLRPSFQTTTCLEIRQHDTLKNRFGKSLHTESLENTVRPACKS